MLVSLLRQWVSDPRCVDEDFCIILEIQPLNKILDRPLLPFAFYCLPIWAFYSVRFLRFAILQFLKRTLKRNDTATYQKRKRLIMSTCFGAVLTVHTSTKEINSIYVISVRETAIVAPLDPVYILRIVEHSRTKIKTLNWKSFVERFVHQRRNGD